MSQEPQPWDSDAEGERLRARGLTVPSSSSDPAAAAPCPYARRMEVIPALPPVGTGFEAVSEIARRRAQGWTTFADGFTSPSVEWVVELRSGVVRQRLEGAIGWRAGELSDFGAPILILGAFERSSRRRDLAADVERLTAAFGELATIASFEAAGGACELLARLCADEAVAWASGQLAKARALRLHQSQELRGEAGEMLIAAAAEIVQRKPRQPYLALGQLSHLWVDRERAGSSFAGGA